MFRYTFHRNNDMAERMLKDRWVPFVLAVPLCLYTCFHGTVFMGFCPGWSCFPHNFAWPLATPCLLLAIWSLPMAATAMGALLSVHVIMDSARHGLSINTLGGTDKGQMYLYG